MNKRLIYTGRAFILILLSFQLMGCGVLRRHERREDRRTDLIEVDKKIVLVSLQG